MRRGPLALLAMAVAGAVAAGGPPPAPDQVPVESPAGQLRLAVTDLAREEGKALALEREAAALAAAGDKAGAKVRLDAALLQRTRLVYFRYLSFAAVPPEARPAFRRAWRFWFNHLSAARALVPEAEVAGSGGTLFRISINDAPNWTRVGWAVVADRDYLFREPLLPNRETVYGRLLTGLEVNDKTFAAGFVLNAFQLFRDSMEAGRLDRTGKASSYYDLLYADRRHPDPDGPAVKFRAAGRPAAPDPGPEPKAPEARPSDRPVRDRQGKWHPAGTRFIDGDAWAKYEADLAKWRAARDAPGRAADTPVAPDHPADVFPARPVGVRDAGKGDANFPATGVDFEKRWDAFVDAKDVKNLLLDPRVGGIAAGRESDPEKGSFVALHDRAIRIVRTRFGFAARTFDVFENTGDRDHLERFREIALGDVRFDAGEILATLPNGAQAGALVNGEDKRVEIATTEAAQVMLARADPRYKDVRTMMLCVGCHGPEDGFIAFAEKQRDVIEKGLRAKNLDPEDSQRQRDFYLSWQARLKRQLAEWRSPYGGFTEEATLGPDGKSWTGQQAWDQMRAARDAYDRPVTIETAAFEFGLTADGLRRRLLGAREEDGPTQARLNMLATGQPVPRLTWQKDVAVELALFLDATKDRDEPVKQLLAPALIDEALKRFGKPAKPPER